MYDVIALGELLIDFTDAGKSADGMRLFERNPGGAVANVLCALARLGQKTGFIGKVGADMHGDFLKRTLQENGVDTEGLVQDAAVFTTLAFVSIGAGGERAFAFARKPGADTCMGIDEVNVKLLQNTRVFHAGSLSLTHQPARAATHFALERAKAAGAMISYDPNYRAPLWSSEQEAAVQMKSVLPYVDIMKLSADETLLLTGVQDPREAALRLNAGGIRCAVVTLGAEGALVAVDEEMACVPSFTVDAVDTTGAGDAFWGAFLYRCLQEGVTARDITLAQAEKYLRFANAAAALCTARRGAIPAMTTLGEIEALLARGGAKPT